MNIVSVVLVITMVALSIRDLKDLQKKRLRKELAYSIGCMAFGIAVVAFIMLGSKDIAKSINPMNLIIRTFQPVTDWIDLVFA